LGEGPRDDAGANAALVPRANATSSPRFTWLVEKIVLEPLDLMHALVEDGDDADVAVSQSFPLHETSLVAEKNAFYAELSWDGF
jgi:hypothetical protein